MLLQKVSSGGAAPEGDLRHALAELSQAPDGDETASLYEGEIAKLMDTIKSRTAYFFINNLCFIKLCLYILHCALTLKEFLTDSFHPDPEFSAIANSTRK